MSAPADLNPTGFAEPPCPLPPDLRSDVAHLRAEGHSWEQVGAALGYEADALRRAAECDPLYPRAVELARASELRAAEARTLSNLRRLLESDDPKVALKAAESILRFTAECRRAEAARERLASVRKPLLWAEAGPTVPPSDERPGFVARLTGRQFPPPPTDDAPQG